MLRLTIKGPRGAWTVAVRGGELLVGSREGADLRIEDSGVAPNHCILRVEGATLRVVDLGGGTVVNGARVRTADLGAGDELRVGAHAIRVERAEAPLALEPAPPSAPAPPPPPPAAAPARASEFEREIRALVARAPWWSVALVVHVVLLWLLTLVEGRVVLERGAALFRAEAPQPARERLDVLPDPDATPPPPPPKPEVVEKFDLEPPQPEAAAPPSVDPVQRPNDADWLRKVRKPKAAKSPAPAVGVGGGGGDDGQEAAARQVEGRLGAALTRLRAGLRPDQLVVLKGEYDSIEKVLEAHSLPFVLLARREQLLEFPFRRDQVLFINCGNKPLRSEAAPYVERVRRFVDSGGWLLTSDWAIDPFLTVGFPEAKIAILRSERAQPHEVVLVEPSAGAEENRLLDGVLGGSAQVPWWIEQSSELFKLAGGSAAEVLIASRQLESKYPGARVIAFRIRRKEGGEVLHLLGHFHQKDDHVDVHSIAGMQHLILNFLRMKYVRDE